MHALLMWLDNENKRHYGRVINIVDSTLTVKDINTGEELTNTHGLARGVAVARNPW